MIMSVVLFLFWIVLSGKFDAFHLTVGALSAAGIAAATARLGRLTPRVSGHHAHTWDHWPFFLPWLAWQIVLSAVQVAKIVLHPDLPISPRVVKFRCRLPNNVAHLTLANSITLTPGTVTVDLHDDEYTIHAMTQKAGDNLIPKRGEGEMQRHVRNLFENAEKE